MISSRRRGSVPRSRIGGALKPASLSACVIASRCAPRGPFESRFRRAGATRPFDQFEIDAQAERATSGSPPGAGLPRAMVRACPSVPRSFSAPGRAILRAALAPSHFAANGIASRRDRSDERSSADFFGRRHQPITAPPATAPRGCELCARGGRCIGAPSARLHSGSIRRMHSRPIGHSRR